MECSLLTHMLRTGKIHSDTRAQRHAELSCDSSCFWTSKGNSHSECFARQAEYTHPPWAESIQAQMSQEIINMGIKDCLKDSGCLEVRLNYLFPVPVLVSFGHKLACCCFHLNLRISQLLTLNLFCCSLWRLLTVHSLAGLWSVYKRAEKLQFSSSSASSRRYSLHIMVIPLILRNHPWKKIWGEEVMSVQESKESWKISKMLYLSRSRCQRGKISYHKPICFVWKLVVKRNVST